MTIYIIISIIVGAVLGLGIYFIVRYFVRRKLFESFGLALFLVKIPRETSPEKSSEKDFKVEINRFEELLASLTSLKKPVVLEIAVPHIGEEIHFYIAVPKRLSEIAIKQIQGLWSGASVELTADDFNIFNPNGATSAAYIKEKENYALPVKTYMELGLDSFSSIVGAFTKVNEIGEGAAMQVIVRPAPVDTKKRVHGFITYLKKGEPLQKIFSHGSPLSFSELGHVLNPKKEEEEKKEKVIDEDAVKALEAKISKPLFQVNVRLLASAGSQFQSDDILDGLAAGFSQFTSPRRNEFKIIKARNPNKLIRQFVFRSFDQNQTMVLSSEEISSFMHFPTALMETPKIKWLKSKEAPPPNNLPNSGVLVGQSSFRGQYKPVYIADDDRRRHVYVVGQTGTGKSTLLADMFVQDIQQGKGMAVIDPHGDLVENALSFIPKERIDDLIYFDPGDLARPLGLNMLDYNYDRPEEKTFIVNEMQSIFNKLFTAETMGPMFEQYMRNALLLLMEDMPNEPATLIEVPRVFTDTEYRLRKLERIQNPVVVDFWEKEAVKAGGEASLANMTPYITSKFNNFIANDYMRPIIGQPKSAFNFRKVMDEGKILLINLSKGRIGDINASLLGMIFTGKLLMAALSRVDTPDLAQRRDFFLYVDEFQNFTTDSISTILSEARKYKLNLTMAHQFISQLTEKIRDSVFGNVGSQLVMRVGAQDAEFLVKQFEPVFSQNDLLNIDNFNAYAKILINGETSKPFNIKVLGTSRNAGNREVAEKLKQYSRVKYGMDRQTIEDDIYKRLRG
ncbi:MAG: type IV secretion system DNA-binding domain-containing protein [Patescibacteria group bacterium]|nr:type IV secretion system DNA-binding domain-containing protein [Patescibacteria group bacterium]MDE2015813.1 type IV secretion system DNA-binding domain-containing protein [Patescibacteria group bacterium]MDE2227188.1 type IV secretion system DNA-binding domain-containing protein [Patescibacteria group bacterium]